MLQLLKVFVWGILQVKHNTKFSTFIIYFWTKCAYDQVLQICQNVTFTTVGILKGSSRNEYWRAELKIESFEKESKSLSEIAAKKIWSFDPLVNCKVVQSKSGDDMVCQYKDEEVLLSWYHPCAKYEEEVTQL